MLRAENPASVKRCAFMRKCRELKLSSNTEAKITVCMMGKTEQEKEELAEKLFEIITESETETEMIEKSRLLLTDFSRKTEIFCDLLECLPPDFEKVEKELKNNSYTPEEVTISFGKFCDNCFCEYSDFVYYKRRKPYNYEIHSTYAYDICKLLLKYGLDPNLKYEDYVAFSSNVMEAVYSIDKPYIAADTLKLLLENGGDPNIWIESETLYEMVDFDIWFDDTHGFATEENFKDKFDCRFHCWLVLKGFIANDGDIEKDYINHGKYTYRFIKDEDGNHDIEIVKKTTYPKSKSNNASWDEL